MQTEELIYDWNAEGEEDCCPDVEFDDETLRDGLQSASARDPDIGDKIRLLHLMEELGIDAADLGLAGASERQFSDVGRLVAEIDRCDMNISPGSAGRTVVADIEPICDIADEVGIPIEVQCFIGSSPIRQYVENWTLDEMLRNTDEAVSFAVDRGMPVMYVTEDTTRAKPDVLRRLYGTAIDCGARRICAADTVGYCTPEGVRAVIRFMRKLVDESGEDVAVDWHGHRDRGMGLANARAAILAGADRIHGTGLGIGERSGNTPMDLLLVNCRLEGWIDNDLSKLGDYCKLVSEMSEIPIPENYPVIGDDAFRTATGVHASAIVKARDKGNEWLADRVYSAVPAEMVGRHQLVEIGPMSGMANVVQWMRQHGIEPSEGEIETVLEAAKASDHVLSENEIREVLE